MTTARTLTPARSTGRGRNGLGDLPCCIDLPGALSAALEVGGEESIVLHHRPSRVHGGVLSDLALVVVGRLLEEANAGLFPDLCELAVLVTRRLKLFGWIKLHRLRFRCEDQ